ncbi:MAG: hypothetical protein Q9217_000996 [Psora testacea]
MDSIGETPVKRRKVDNGDVSNGYDSQNDSGDDIFETYQTVDTVPLPRISIQKSSTWTPTQHITQPTQIIGQDSIHSSSAQKPTVQVTASSPIRSSNVASPTPTPAKPAPILASKMAPLGTAFRPPAGIVRAPTAPMVKVVPVVDVSDDDDGPLYRGGSSDDDSQFMKADIKPSSFITQAQKIDNKPRGPDRFKEIASKAMYDPSSKTANASVRSSDILANAYGGGRIRHVPQARKHAPTEAKPVEAQQEPFKDISITDIQDNQLRIKIKRILEVLPGTSILSARNALIKKRANYDDALDYLAAQDGKPVHIDLTLEENNEPSQATLYKKPAAKQQIKAPIQKIQEKWTSTQSVPTDVQSSSPKVAIPTLKPRRRLVQGRKNELAPAEAPSSGLSRALTPRSVSPDSANYDSGLGEDIDESASEEKVLRFFKSCSIADLADIAAITEELASVILMQRPFPSLKSVREVSSGPPASAKGKRYTRKSIGDKVVEKCLNMWTGFEAVDQLVSRCEDLSKPLKDAMVRWGVDVYGSASGEIELAHLDMLSTGTRDSGVGTPTSRCVSADEDGDGDIPKVATRKHGFFPQPSIMAKDVTLKEYQVVGINWLSLLFNEGLSCILADDMGLGKTCQVIAFLAHLLEKGIKGPHLIIVPGSTLENWLREFSVFCPKLQVEPYYGSQKDRPEIRDRIEANATSINVIVTTYDLATKKDDNKFLRKLRPICCVYDEGHFLRNSTSARYEAFMRINAQFRLLLTGTPLQNNLRELISLLGFILPSVFREHTGDLEAIFSHKAKTTNSNESHAALLSMQRTARAKSMMSPFVLRRKKHQVLKQLPKKHSRVEMCELSLTQTEIYRQELARVVRICAARKTGEDSDTGKESTNIMMRLRQASIHSLLFRRIYNNETVKKMSIACLGEDQFRDSNPDLVLEEMLAYSDWELHTFCERYPSTMSSFLLQNDEWMDSGKVKALSALLQQYKDNGDRVLIFSQFVMVHDILEAVLESLGMRFFRLDGSTKMDERQTMIDEFSSDPEITAFLLSTKAGGAGINLACANKVVIFDSSFNPQDDIQAENRAHRVGQSRDVEVVRLITKDTVEEDIHALGQTKLSLDDRVAGDLEETEHSKAEKHGEEIVKERMMSKIQEEMKAEIEKT